MGLAPKRFRHLAVPERFCIWVVIGLYTFVKILRPSHLGKTHLTPCDLLINKILATVENQNEVKRKIGKAEAKAKGRNETVHRAEQLKLETKCPPCVRAS